MKWLVEAKTTGGDIERTTFDEQPAQEVDKEGVVHFTGLVNGQASTLLLRSAYYASIRSAPIPSSGQGPNEVR